MLRKLRTEWQAISLEKKLGMFVAPIFVTVVGALLVAALSGGGDGGDAGAAPATPRAAEVLEVVDLAVGGGKPPTFGGPPGIPQYLDITLRNTGTTVSVVKRARLTIRDFGFLEICEAGGGLEATARYDVTLPTRPHRNEVVEAKVSQALAPNAADRFELRVNVPERAMQFGTYLYRLEVALLHDTARRPLRAGTALVSAPYVPSRLYFPASVRGFDLANDPFGVMHCYQKNEDTLRRMLALPGARAPEVTLDLLEPEPS